VIFNDSELWKECIDEAAAFQDPVSISAESLDALTSSKTFRPAKRSSTHWITSSFPQLAHFSIFRVSFIPFASAARVAEDWSQSWLQTNRGEAALLNLNPNKVQILSVICGVYLMQSVGLTRSFGFRAQLMSS